MDAGDRDDVIVVCRYAFGEREDGNVLARIRVSPYRDPSLDILKSAPSFVNRS
jgi:hypothetical protein